MTSRNSGSLYFKCFHCKHILFGRLEVQLQLFSVTKKARALKSWLIFNPVITRNSHRQVLSSDCTVWTTHTTFDITRTLNPPFFSQHNYVTRPSIHAECDTHTHKVKTRFLGMGPHTLFCLSSWKPWHMCLSLGAAWRELRTCQHSASKAQCK